MDVVEWFRALDVRLSEWCCSVSMVWVQIPSREEQTFDSSKMSPHLDTLSRFQATAQRYKKKDAKM